MEELSYEKLLREEKLTVSQLPKNITLGIKNIEGKKKAINMREKGGKTVSANQLEQLEYADKQVTRDILEFIDSEASGKAANAEKEKQAAEAMKQKQEKEKTENEAKEKAEAERIAAEKEKKENESTQEPVKTSDPKGIKIEEELAALFKEGKAQLTIEEFKKFAPVAYSVVFDNYEAGGENGVSTSRYEAKETEKEKFTITKI